MDTGKFPTGAAAGRRHRGKIILENLHVSHFTFLLLLVYLCSPLQGMTLVPAPEPEPEARSPHRARLRPGHSAFCARSVYGTVPLSLGVSEFIVKSPGRENQVLCGAVFSTVLSPRPVVYIPIS